MIEGSYQCPCCDFFTLHGRGSFECCPICYWEDDGQDLDQPDRVSDANHITLRQARRNFERLGACDQAALSLVVSERARQGVRRERRDE